MTPAVTLRPARPADATALERLAQRDSRRLPDGRLLVAEVDGELLAALPMDGSAEAIADPFRPTAELVVLLRLRAGSVRRGSRTGAPQMALQWRMPWRALAAGQLMPATRGSGRTVPRGR